MAVAEEIYVDGSNNEYVLSPLSLEKRTLHTGGAEVSSRLLERLSKRLEAASKSRRTAGH